MQRSLRTLRVAGVALLAGVTAYACGGDDGGGGGTTEPDPDPAQIQVTVTADGSNQSGVSVSLFNAGGTSSISTQTTGTAGTVTFSNLDAGGYEVEVTPPSGFQLAQGESGRKSVTATAGQTANVSFSLTATTGGGGQPTIVQLQTTSFNPASVTIATGATVRWVNAQAITHSITPDGHNEWQDVTVSAANETFEHTFNSTGTFDYDCVFHAGMSGTVVVQ